MFAIPLLLQAGKRLGMFSELNVLENCMGLMHLGVLQSWLQEDRYPWTVSSYHVVYPTTKRCTVKTTKSGYELQDLLVGLFHRKIWGFSLEVHQSLGCTKTNLPAFRKAMDFSCWHCHFLLLLCLRPLLSRRSGVDSSRSVFFFLLRAGGKRQSPFKVKVLNGWWGSVKNENKMIWYGSGMWRYPKYLQVHVSFALVKKHVYCSWFGVDVSQDRAETHLSARLFWADKGSAPLVFRRTLSPTRRMWFQKSGIRWWW